MGGQTPIRIISFRLFSKIYSFDVKRPNLVGYISRYLPLSHTKELMYQIVFYIKFHNLDLKLGPIAQLLSLDLLFD